MTLSSSADALSLSLQRVATSEFTGLRPQALLGLFDSGLGGLTVLRRLLSQRPGQRCVYVGDTARVPYGSRDRAEIRSIAAEVVGWLREQGAEAVVMACNTTNALALDVAQSEAGVPVLGLIDAAGDQMARGFIMGATAGRTTLTGEGLQHADGHSPLLASTNPAVITYDPAYSYEIAHIVKAGLERMYGGNHPDPNVMYYLTIYNEPMVQPDEPEGLDVDGLLKGIYLLKKGSLQGAPTATILASGVGMAWALEAQELLAKDWSVNADVYSVTSWNELRRDGVEAERHNFLHPDQPAQVPYVTQKLSDAQGPIVAVSDFMHSVQDQIREFVPGTYLTLGADGFGFSDTRPAARRHFAIDGPSITARVLQQLAKEGSVAPDALQQAVTKYQLLDVTAGTSGSAGGEA